MAKVVKNYRFSETTLENIAYLLEWYKENEHIEFTETQFIELLIAQRVNGCKGKLVSVADLED